MWEQKLGVVLWTNAESSLAVIWCEDHGDLGYYRADPETQDGDVVLSEGDLVRCQVQDGLSLRRVQAPHVVHQGHATQLAQKLRRAVGGLTRDWQGKGADVLTFPQQRAG